MRRQFLGSDSTSHKNAILGLSVNLKLEAVMPYWEAEGANHEKRISILFADTNGGGVFPV